MANIPKVWNGTAFIELEAAATVAPAASTSVVGIVQLTDSTSSTSTTTAATPNSVKSAYDLAGTAIPKNTVTAAGDILYASGSATVARLGIGTANQVLGVAAGVPAWTTPAGGGGLTALGTVTASAGTALEFTSIPTTYKHLLVRWQGVYQSTTTGYWNVRVNGDTGSAYIWQTTSFVNNLGAGGDKSKTATTFGGPNSNTAVIPRTSSTSTNYDEHSAGSIVFYDYADTSLRRSIQSSAWAQGVGGDTSGVIWSNVNGYYASTGTAITSITFVRSSTQTINGTFFLYGVS
jgi:hypothetical protein